MKYEIRLADQRGLAQLLLLPGGDTADFNLSPHHRVRFHSYADAAAIASILARNGDLDVFVYDTYTTKTTRFAAGRKKPVMNN